MPERTAEDRWLALDLAYGEQGRVRTDFGADDVIEWITGLDFAVARYLP